jgi:hypothetical protein
MAFGLNVPKAGDFADIIKYDARAGRLFRVDFDQVANTKVNVDITTPAPKFALDFGSMQVGYIKFTSDGPDFKTVPLGSALPDQPQDKDDKNRRLYRAGFKIAVYGRALNGIREWASTATCVLDVIDDLHKKFLAASQAAAGQIPIVEMTKTIPLTFGKGTRASTNYAPCFVIAGWTDRVPEMGPRTVPAPTKLNGNGTGATPIADAASSHATMVPQRSDDLSDEIPF